MSDRHLGIKITASDGASKTFVAVGNAATKTGDAINQAGEKGERSLRELEMQAQQSGKSMDDLKNKATAAGAAVGVFGSAVIALGSAHRDESRQLDGINRLYGEHSDTILAMSENIQDYTRYSNDAARESALVASSLATNYELSADQIALLVERSADLAQIYGVDLVDAVTRTSGAIRGEGEAFERLGGNMSDAAVAARALEAGITNWSVPGALSEAEKAAFRFQLFLEDTASAAGAASEAAAGAGGGFREFANNVQDAGQRLGGFLGPIGEVGAELAPMVVALPVAAAGLGRLSTSLGQTAVAGRAAQIALSPVGGTLAAITLAAVAGYAAWQIYDEALSSSAVSLERYLVLAEEARLSGDPKLAEQFERAEEGADRFRDTVNRIRQENTGSNGFANLPIMPPDADEAWNSMVATIEKNLQDTRVDQEAYLTWVEQQWAFANSILSNPQLLAANPNIVTETIERINNVDMSKFRQEVDLSAVRLVALAQAAAIAGAGLDAIRTDAEKAGGAFSGALVAGLDAAVDSHQDYLTALDNFHTGITSFLSEGGNILDFWLAYEEAANQGAASFSGTEAQYRAWLAAMEKEADFRALVQLSADLDAANQSFDQVLRTFEQIDSLGSRSSSAGSIAEALVGTPGEWAAVDDLLESGRISLEQYQATVRSGYAIQESAAEQAMMLNEIRADQLPLLEQETLAYRRNLEAIAAMEPLEQRRALMLQDTAVQSKIASDYALAYSASVGEIPEEVATSVILQSAEADAGLMDLYLQMGLIEEVWENGEKTLRVNFPDGPTVQESIMGLTDAIDRLYLQLGGDPLMLNIGVNDEATPVVEEVVSQLEGTDGQTATVYATGDGTHAIGIIHDVTGELITLDGRSATVDVYANDWASGVLSGISGMLNSLDGRQATVTTVQRTVFERRQEMALGGIPGFAMGGTVLPIWAAENGPEVAHFANGGSAVLPREGMYGVPPMTYISPANANPGLGSGGGLSLDFHFHGPVYGNDSLTEMVLQEAVPILVEVISNGRDSQVRIA